MTDLIGSFLSMRSSIQLKARFVMVGIWNTIFGYMVFFILDTFFEDIFTKRYFAYMSAMILGQIVATINAFVLHKYVTFKSEVKGKGIIPEFFRFCMTYVFTFSLSLILLPFLVEVIGFHPRIGAAVIIIITTIVSYFGHSRFSFSPTNKK